MGSAKMGQVGYSVSRNTISYQQNQAKKYDYAQLWFNRKILPKTSGAVHNYH